MQVIHITFNLRALRPLPSCKSERQRLAAQPVATRMSLLPSSAAVTGSPSPNVAVTNSDTAATVAGKIRTALEAQSRQSQPCSRSGFRHHDHADAHRPPQMTPH